QGAVVTLVVAADQTERGGRPLLTKVLVELSGRDRSVRRLSTHDVASRGWEQLRLEGTPRPRRGASRCWRSFGRFGRGRRAWSGACIASRGVTSSPAGDRQKHCHAQPCRPCNRTRWPAPRRFHSGHLSFVDDPHEDFPSSWYRVRGQMFP